MKYELDSVMMPNQMMNFKHKLSINELLIRYLANALQVLLLFPAGSCCCNTLTEKQGPNPSLPPAIVFFSRGNFSASWKR